MTDQTQNKSDMPDDGYRNREIYDAAELIRSRYRDDLPGVHSAINALEELAYHAVERADVSGPHDPQERQEWFYRWAARAMAGKVSFENAIRTIFCHPGNPYGDKNPWDDGKAPTEAQNADGFDYFRVRDWALANPRARAFSAFTAGIERNVAYLIEDIQGGKDTVAPDDDKLAILAGKLSCENFSATNPNAALLWLTLNAEEIIKALQSAARRGGEN